MMPSLFFELPGGIHLWATFGFIILAMWLYMSERLPVEMASLLLLGLVLLFFYLAPYAPPSGKPLKPDQLLGGFSNPALIAVMALLVIGQAVVNTGSLNGFTNLILRLGGHRPLLLIAFTLLCTILTSTILNDTTTCVIFIPIMLAVVSKLNISASRVMIPISYACILGGAVLLIGSSTNLLVSGALENLGEKPLGMFDFALPGAIIASIGWIYIAFFLPKLLPERAPLASDLVGDATRQFVVQLEVAADSFLVGKGITDENLLGVEDVAVKMLQRYEHAYLAPFEEPIRIRPYDVVVLTTTKKSLVELLSSQDKRIFGKIAALNALEAEAAEKKPENLILAEVLIAPASRMIGLSIEQIGFYHNYHCTVVGIQRRSRMITSRMTEIRLAAGDVLMVMGTREHIEAMRETRDLILMEGSTKELPSKRNALRVNLIFGGVVALAISEMLPLHLSALLGALLIVLTGCLTHRQAFRAMDTQIITLVAAGMALATALEVTGGAAFLARQLVSVMDGADPVWVMSALFGLMGISTNILSNNACALLFTPIAVSTAHQVGAPPEMFIHAVIFGTNCCSFASPIGFQTNLLVMGPGHYRFNDYMKAGIPLLLIVWVTYTAFCFFYY